MSQSCIGIILAGGKSQRMGLDKAQLCRGEQSMLDFCRQLLRDCGITDIRISRNIDSGIRDIYPHCGPLAGIHAVLQWTGLGNAIILPVDMPLLQCQDLLKLIERGQALQRPVYYQQSVLPLFLPFDHRVLDYLEKQLSSQGNLKVHGLIEQFAGIGMPLGEPNTLFNTNTPQQWQQIQNDIVN